MEFLGLRSTSDCGLDGNLLQLLEPACGLCSSRDYRHDSSVEHTVSIFLTNQDVVQEQLMFGVWMFQRYLESGLLLN